MDTETAAVIDAKRGNIPKTAAIDELMERGVGGSTGQSTPTYKPKTVKSKQSKVEKDFSFDLISCKVSDQTVTCTFMVTNKGNDTKLWLYGESRIYDDSGNEHLAQTVGIANTKKDLRGNHYIGKVLISGVPTKTMFTFQKVSADATIISAFKMRCEADDRGRFWVNFRNIPLTK